MLFVMWLCVLSCWVWMCVVCNGVVLLLLGCFVDWLVYCLFFLRVVFCLRWLVWGVWWMVW